MSSQVPTTHIDVVGGGLAGLVAAIEASSRGLDVDLWEAHAELGGRARTAQPYRANFGPHALYNDGATWAWLTRHGLLPPVVMPSVRTGFVHGEVFGRVPPSGLRRGLRLLYSRALAPSGVSAVEWLADRLGSADDAELSCRAFFPFYDSDVGSQDASVVWDVMRRTRWQPARYVVGGWSTMVAMLEQRALANGVRIHLHHPFDLGDRGVGPTIVATELATAARLLADESLTWPSSTVACLDVGLAAETLSRQGKRRASAIDLDNVGFISRYTSKDRSLAPSGGEVIQATGSRRAGESIDASVERIRAGLDAVYPGWSEGVSWSRRFDASGRATPWHAPGTTWHDRPAIDRGGNCYLVGDHVAAPGFLAEVSVNSAVQAVEMVAVASRDAQRIW